MITTLIDRKKVDKYAVYLIDYGAPIGYRMYAKNPKRVSGFLIQNGNAYEEGLKEFWDPLKAYWADGSPHPWDDKEGVEDDKVEAKGDNGEPVETSENLRLKPDKAHL